jgi:hypothetical protein
MMCVVPKNVDAPGGWALPERSQFGREDGSKRNQPQMTQINADELKRPVKRPEIPSSSSASSAVKTSSLLFNFIEGIPRTKPMAISGEWVE